MALGIGVGVKLAVNDGSEHCVLVTVATDVHVGVRLLVVVGVCVGAHNGEAVGDGIGQSLNSHCLPGGSALKKTRGGGQCANVDRSQNNSPERITPQQPSTNTGVAVGQALALTAVKNNRPMAKITLCFPIIPSLNCCWWCLLPRWAGYEVVKEA